LPTTLRITVCLGFIASLLLSPKLWLSGRFYPLTPVAAFLSAIPPPFDYIIYATLLLLLVRVAAASHPAKWIAVFVAVAAVYAMFDQSRWQPWFYQYLFMLVAIGLRARNACRLIIVSIYFWSGLQKFNSGFLFDTFPWMLQPFGALPPAFAYAAPISEAAVAIGLLTRRFRNLAVIAALGMHAFILACIGPFGHNSNRVVWPWNIAMSACVVLLFWRTPWLTVRDIVWGSPAPMQRLVLLLFTILPAFSFAGLWDSYPSFSLYSGNQNQAAIYMDDAVADRLPTRIQEVVSVFESASQVDSLDIEEWSYAELNVPPYAEVRVLTHIARDVCAETGNAPQMVLAIGEKRLWFRRRRLRLYTCAMLKR
jgi:hypothetical protein